MPKEHKAEFLDYSKAIFGYSNEKESYKSRVSFSDAVVEGDYKELEKRIVTLSEPKPTSYLDYLKNDDEKIVTYNNEDFELRGVKQYWLHKEIQQQTVKNEKVATALCPLDKGTCFSGKVRFRNLYQDELGLLLWSIQLNENSWMNVGKAKSFGYGNISVEIVSAKQLDIQKAYDIEEMLNLKPWKEINIKEMIQIYKDTINNNIGGKTSLERLPYIKNFFAMKDSTLIPKKEAIRYMSIDKKEYQSRKKPLPTIEKVIEEVSEEVIEEKSEKKLKN